MITFEETLALVPEYILLNPGVEMREGDEELKQSTLGSRWIEPFQIRDAMLAYRKVEPHMIVRRRIHQKICEGIARTVSGFIYDQDSTLFPHFELMILSQIKDKAAKP